jgi:signal transduction histidine kinase
MALSYVETHPSMDRAIPIHNIGRTYQKIGQFNKAVSFLRQAIEINLELNDKEGLAYDYYELGEVYREVKNYGLAEKNYKNSLEYAYELNIKTVIANNLIALAKLNRENNKYQVALKLQEDYEKYTDSVFNENNTLELAKLQFAFEIEKKEREIELLKLSNQSASLLNKRNNILIYGSISLVFLLSLIIGILFSQNRIKKSMIIEQSEINERIYDHNTSLAHYNERLKYSKERLSELNATKDKFFSIISHDLRSPLNSLSGMLQILMKNSEVFSIEELVGYGKKINESVNNLTVLLENLLQWSNTQMGKVRFNPTEFNVSKEIESLLELYKITIEEKQIDVKSDVKPSLMIYADKNMFNFITRNLLTNALKFTMKKGEVRISAEDLTYITRISIQDNGVGIHEENIPKLFAIKHHYTTPGTAKEKGTGLGLILSQEFVNRHNGSIRVESKVEEGSTFIVDFPKKEQSMKE